MGECEDTHSPSTTIHRALLPRLDDLCLIRVRSHSLFICSLSLLPPTLIFMYDFQPPSYRLPPSPPFSLSAKESYCDKGEYDGCEGLILSLFTSSECRSSHPSSIMSVAGSFKLRMGYRVGHPPIITLCYAFFSRCDVCQEFAFRKCCSFMRWGPFIHVVERFTYASYLRLS